MPLNSMFDAYTLRARVAPVVLLALPCVVLLTLFGLPPAAFGLAAAGLVAVIVLVPAGQVAERGRAAQRVLFATWGGPPTARAICLFENPEPERAAARREAIEQVSNIRLPSVDEERTDPLGAKRLLDDAVTRVRSNLRDDDGNRILADANAEYGFRRNCYGVRRTGTVIAVGSGLAGTAWWVSSDDASLAAFVASIATSLALVGFWTRVVTRRWVHAAALRYTAQFYETLMKRTYVS